MIFLQDVESHHNYVVIVKLINLLIFVPTQVEVPLRLRLDITCPNEEDSEDVPT